MYLLLPILVLILSSCSTTQFSLKSTEAPAFLNEGIAYNSRSYNNIVYSVGPAEAIEQGLQFSVHIENKSTQPVTVSSEDFTLISGDSVINAEVPEAIIEKINKDLDYEQSTYDPLAKNLIGTAPGIGNTMAQVQERQRKREKEALESQTKIKNLTRQRDLVVTRYLRKTTLKPGDNIKGLVLFKTYSSWKSANKNFLLRIANIKEASNTIPFTVVKD